MSCSYTSRVLVNSFGAADFPISPGPTPVDISCHPKVPNLGHSVGPSAAQQTVPGSNIPAELGKISLP